MKHVHPVDFFAIKEVLEEESKFCCSICHSPINTRYNEVLSEGEIITCPVCGETKVMINPFTMANFATISNYTGQVGLAFNHLVDFVHARIVNGLAFPLLIPKVPKKEKLSEKRRIMLAVIHGIIPEEETGE